MAPPVTVGEIVLYKMTAFDAQIMNERRRIWPGPVPHLGHWGNILIAGTTFPAIVVSFTGTVVNLQVFVDGNDTYWLPSVQEGTSSGQWQRT